MRKLVTLAQSVMENIIQAQGGENIDGTRAAFEDVASGSQLASCTLLNLKLRLLYGVALLPDQRLLTGATK